MLMASLQKAMACGRLVKEFGPDRVALFSVLVTSIVYMSKLLHNKRSVLLLVKHILKI